MSGFILDLSTSSSVEYPPGRGLDFRGRTFRDPEAWRRHGTDYVVPYRNLLTEMTGVVDSTDALTPGRIDVTDCVESSWKRGGPLV